MKTTLKMIIGSLVLSSAAFAGTGPDFVGAPSRAHIDRSLVASSGTNPIEPGDIVPFANDSAQLSALDYEQIDRAALWLKVHPHHNIVVEGHADHAGTEPYNEGLSILRAQAVHDRLVKQGVPRSRIMMIASGETDLAMNPAARRVRLYATRLSPQAIYAMAAEQKKVTEPEQTARR